MLPAQEETEHDLGIHIIFDGAVGDFVEILQSFLLRSTQANEGYRHLHAPGQASHDVIVSADDQLRVSEAKFNAHLRALTDTLPQLRDLWVIGADGHPIVSGTIYPMPDIDLSDRQYFRVHKNNEVQGVYISELLEARAADLRFFALSRKRVDQYGQFNGVTTIHYQGNFSE